jgi:hypothetical protein
VTEAIQVTPLEVPQSRQARLGTVQVEELYHSAQAGIVPSPLRQVHVGHIEKPLTAISFGLGDAAEFRFPFLRAQRR